MKVKKTIYRWKRYIEKRKERRLEKLDTHVQLRVIDDAERQSKERKCRLWVVRIAPAHYRIYTKGDVKAILRRLGMKGRIDIFSENGTVVHITK